MRGWGFFVGVSIIALVACANAGNSVDNGIWRRIRYSGGLYHWLNKGFEQRVAINRAVPYQFWSNSLRRVKISMLTNTVYILPKNTSGLWHSAQRRMVRPQ